MGYAEKHLLQQRGLQGGLKEQEVASPVKGCNGGVSLERLLRLGWAKDGEAKGISRSGMVHCKQGGEYLKHILVTKLL